MEVDEDLTQHRRRGLELLPASILSRQPNADHRESSPAMRSIATFPASSATAGHRIELPLPLATTAGQKGEQRSSAAETEKVKTALIESSHSRAPPYRLPPRKHGGDTEPPPPSTAPQHQDGRARKDGEDGLIFGDLSPQLHRLQQLPPPELHSDKYQDEHEPDPADGSQRSTPRRHYGTSLTPTIQPNYAGVCPQPSPTGNAGREGLGPTREEDKNDYQGYYLFLCCSFFRQGEISHTPADAACMRPYLYPILLVVQQPEAYLNPFQSKFMHRTSLGTTPGGHQILTLFSYVIFVPFLHFS